MADALKLFDANGNPAGTNLATNASGVPKIAALQDPNANGLLAGGGKG
jgi:hypothetical protein